MKNLAKDALITLFGALTSIATAAALVLAFVVFDFSFHKLMWWIVPIGALVSGFVASAGYRWGAKRLSHRPGSILLVSIIVLSVCTPLLVDYIHYSLASTNGVPLRERVTFIAYLKHVNSHSVVTIRDEDWQKVRTFEIGLWGYGLACLQFAGFALAGFVSLKNLRKLPWCPTCSRYLQKTSEGSRFCKHQQDLRLFLDEWIVMLAAGNVPRALAHFHAYGNAKPRQVGFREAEVRMELANWRCAGCDYTALELSLAKWTGEEWDSGETIRLVGRSGSPFEVQSNTA